MSGCGMVWFSNGGLKTGQKISVLWSKMSGMVRLITWSDHLKTIQKCLKSRMFGIQKFTVIVNCTCVGFVLASGSVQSCLWLFVLNFMREEPHMVSHLGQWYLSMALAPIGPRPTHRTWYQMWQMSHSIWKSATFLDWGIFRHLGYFLFSPYTKEA